MKRLLPFFAALLAALFQVTGILSPVERLVGDALQRTLPARASTHVAVVFIDETSLRREGPWPWERARLARLAGRIADAGAQGIALDLMLPEAREGDDALAAALARLPAVLPVGIGEDGRFLGPGPALRQNALAHVSFNLDGDGVVRCFPATRQVDGRMLAALPVAASRLLDPGRPIPVGQILRPAWRARNIPALGASAVLAGEGLAGLRGRIVLVGASATGIGDRWVTPASRDGSPDPGVSVEAAATEAFLTRDLLRPAAPLVNAGLALVLGWAALSGGGYLVLAALAPFLAAAAALTLGGLELAPVAVAAGILVPGGLALALAGRGTRRGLQEARERIRTLEGMREALPDAGRREAEARRVLAHELKTPLTSMRGLAQLLADFDLSPAERDRVAGLVVAESSRMAQMVDGLLDLERLAFRDFGREASPLDLGDLVGRRLEVLRLGAERPWEVDLAPHLDVLGDPALLAGVVENLVGNALKYSPPGSPVRVSLRAQDADALLEVEDRGPGVPEKERSEIFGRFNRGSARGLAPGLGLGLALVAETVAWHQGSVEVDAGSAGGALFRVRLPRVPVRADGGGIDDHPCG